MMSSGLHDLADGIGLIDSVRRRRETANARSIPSYGGLGVDGIRKTQNDRRRDSWLALEQGLSRAALRCPSLSSLFIWSYGTVVCFTQGCRL